MKNKNILFVFIILTLFIITISSASAEGISSEDLTISEGLTADNGNLVMSDDLAIDNEDSINQELIRDDTINDELEDNDIQSDNIMEREALSDSNSITVTDRTFSGIQDAIDGAEGGSTIVLDGYYIGNGSQININKELTFIGVNNAHLDANNLSGIFSFHNNIIIKDIVFQNGNSWYGGAIYCSDANCTIENCSFVNNSASSNGGAIYYQPQDFKKCTIVNCSFVNNSADDGGAISSSSYNGIICNGCRFEANSASEDGGAIYRGNAVNCTFVNNTAKESGGAIWGGNALNCTFIGNKVQVGLFSSTIGKGGAIYGGSSVVNSTFKNSYAAEGGAIYSSSSLDISNCSFENNSAKNYGAVFIAGGEIINCTSINNTVSNQTAISVSFLKLNESFDQESGDRILIANLTGVGTLSNKVITFTINDVNYEETTDSNGIATFNITEIGGNKISASFAGDSDYSSSFIELYAKTFSGIQELINDAEEGATITLDGYYYNDLANAISISKKLTIVGINNATLDNYVSSPSKLFEIWADNVTLFNITFKNSGDYVIDAEEGLIIQNCTFINNTGGVILSSVDWNPYGCNISDCIFINNSGFSGAVLANIGSYNIFTNCSFINNHANDAGGVAENYGTNYKASFLDCIFINNSARIGGVCHDSGGGYIDFNNCSFINNSATSNGSVIYSHEGNISVVNCSFEIDVTLSNIYEDYCGAIYSDGANLSVVNCSFEFSNLIVEDNTFSAIQMAINIANPGDTITLNGTYSNDINRTINIGKQLNFNGINNATLDAGKLSSIFNISAEGVSFKDITFKNGKSSYYGGAILANDVLNLSVVNCSFIDNYASSNGGAIACDNVSVVNSSFNNNFADSKGGAIFCINGSLVNCSFANNSAYSRGGAIACDNVSVINCSFYNNSLDHVVFGSSSGGAIYTIDISVFNCSFSRNCGEMGGAIYSENGSIIQSTFVNNSAKYRGGAIYCNKNCSILDSKFINNSASNYGGALFIKSSDEDGNAIITFNCTFENNTARWGGAVSFEGYGNLSNCTFINNKATESGGALFNGTAIDCTFINNTANDGGALSNSSAVGCTFISNSATNGGGVLYLSNASECTFINNTANYGGATYYSDSINCNFTGNSATNGGVGVSSSFNNCTFINNTAVNGGVGTLSNFHNCTFESNSATNGGAIFENNTSDSYDLIGCTFINNTATNGGVIYLENTTSTKISNLSFEFNNAYDGGAIYTESCENIAIENCSFESNKAQNNGGALDINKGTYSISNSNFTYNSAINQSGGAIWTDAIGSIKNCSFANNTADNMSGGAIWVYENGSIENCTFINNSATWGGAIRVDKSNILNCNFENNTATGGGAITSTSQLTVENCNFTNNRAKNNGGALDVSSGSNYILNCSFVNNSANYNGGAIRFSHDGEILNCTFAYNSAKDLGGAIFFNNKGAVNGSSFVNNTAKNYGGAIQLASGSAYNCSFVNCSAQSMAGGAVRINKGTIENCSFTNCSSVVAGGVYANNNTNIIGSSFVNCSSSNVGGAVRMGTGSIKDCSFENCQAPNMGGALWVAESGSVEDSRFVNNTATVVGGAIYINDVVELYKISNCTFENNAVENESSGDNRTGGAINCLAKNCEINNCTFNNNSAPDAGGAIYVSDNNTSMKISNSKFNNNSVSNYFDGDIRGGGAICSLSNGITIDRCNFVSNTAEDSFGGALRLIYDSEVEGAVPPSVKKSNFHNNDAFRGGSVYTDGESVFILNGFMYTTEDEKNEMICGLSIDELEEYNTFTKSKLNSTIYPIDVTLVFGQDIVIPVSSDNVNTINLTITDSNNQVVFSKEVLANDEVIVPKLTPGTYTVKYVTNVDEDMFNPSSAQSKLTINKAKSTVSASAVTAYYGKAFSIKVNSKNATSIKYTIKNSKGTAVKSGTIAAGASITGLKFAPGTYTLSLTTVVDGNHTSSSASSKITVKKSTAGITAKALTKYYAVTKKWSIKLMDKTNNKVIANQKITVRVYTGKKYKNYTVKTNAKGIATFKAPSGLKVGTHKVVLIFSHKYYTCKSLTSKIVVKKHPLNIRISFQQFTDGSRTVDVVVKSKVTNKPVNKMKLKVFIYTGSKVTKKYLKLVSGYYKFNKQNGFAMYGGGIKAFGKAGAHKIKVMPNDSRYSSASNIIKISVPKTAKNIKTVVVSKGKYSTVK